MLQTNTIHSSLKVVFFCAFLSMLLWYTFGSLWFSFYGYNSILIIILFTAFTILRKKQDLPNKERWSFYIISTILGLNAFLEIGYWFLFFRIGPTNPELGLLREMLRPSLEIFRPYIVSLLFVLWLFLLSRRVRNDIP